MVLVSFPPLSLLPPSISFSISMSVIPSTSSRSLITNHSQTRRIPIQQFHQYHHQQRQQHTRHSPSLFRSNGSSPSPYHFSLEGNGRNFHSLSFGTHRYHGSHHINNNNNNPSRSPLSSSCPSLSLSPSSSPFPYPSPFPLRFFSLLQTSQKSEVPRYENRLKSFPHITSTLQNTILVDKTGLWKGRSFPALTEGQRKKGGRSTVTGRITVRHQGGGHKRNYRIIDFKRDLHDVIGVIQRLEYDPNRSALIALVLYANKEIKYILHCEGMNVGDLILSSTTLQPPIKVGNSMPLSMIPIGTKIHNIEQKPGKGGQYCRGAGTSAKILEKESKNGHVLLLMSSNEKRYFRQDCLATIGEVGNKVWRLQKFGKAGRMRNRGIRPTVRGMAMNPIDHPLGGGNGKSKGRHPCSPTGVLAKGYKTRPKWKRSAVILQRRDGKVMIKAAKGNTTLHHIIGSPGATASASEQKKKIKAKAKAKANANAK